MSDLSRRRISVAPRLRFVIYEMSWLRGVGLCTLLVAKCTRGALAGAGLSFFPEGPLVVWLPDPPMVERS